MILRTPSSIAVAEALAAPRTGPGRSPPILSVEARSATVCSASRGQIASAPKPSRQAKWCTSRGSSLSTTIDARRAARRARAGDARRRPRAASARRRARATPPRSESSSIRRRRARRPRRVADAAVAGRLEALAGSKVASSADGRERRRARDGIEEEALELDQTPARRLGEERRAAAEERPQSTSRGARGGGRSAGSSPARSAGGSS